MYTVVQYADVFSYLTKACPHDGPFYTYDFISGGWRLNPSIYAEG